MIKTERKHWVNGYQKRGGFFHTYTMTIPLSPYAVMFSRAIGKKAPAFRPQLKLYKLI